ncbi:motility-associated protein [Planctomicrobium sp. SH661]|uniref:motility-associated protein n=1 Tax=Planctomicrobium sp. SH661 TaxID=3448124 RepID=UPI003F5BF36B
MVSIIGIIVVLGAVLLGFNMAGGHIHALIHPSEIITIGGAALGAMIAGSPKQVLVDLVKGLIGVVKGGNCSKKTYREVFQVLYYFFCVARRDGLLALESILSEEGSGSPFHKYPSVAKDHHLKDFISDALVAASEGADGPQLQALLETDIRVVDEQHHAAVGALTRTADALPGFGIVAAVLGIVITMGAIDGPVEEIGHKVGAALVGTFLGILMSYGIIGPLAAAMESMGHAETALRKTVASAVVDFVEGGTPKAALEKARRGVTTDCRPSMKDMEEIFKAAA